MSLKVAPRRRLYISNEKILTDPTFEEIEEIKKRLTFDNPAYKNALRYSRYSRVSLPPYLTYYSQTKYNGKQCIRVPVGFDLASVVEDFSSLEVIDERVCPEAVNPSFVLKLRDNQKEAAESFLRTKDSLSPHNIIQLPTGKGKSILGLYIASQLHCKTLIVVHKDDLVSGWQKDIALAFNKKVKAGLIKAKSREVGSFLTIATVQTLNRLTSEELDKLHSTFGFVIQDEMHHCPASSYSVVAGFRAKYRLGLTATPERADGLAHIMNLYYGSMCYQYKDDGEETDILPVKVIRKTAGVYFNPLFQKVGSASGRTVYKLLDMYAPKDVEMKEDYFRLSEIPYERRPNVAYQVIDSYVVTNPEYMELVCEDIVSEYDEGHSCVVFFTQKEHCRLYYDYLKESISESHLGLYYGDNSDNKSVLEKAEKTRKFVTLTTYAKATEGTNVRQWEVEFLVSSINSEKNTEQAVGRIRRTKDGKINPVRVYDYRVPGVYSLSSHGATRDRRYRQLGFVEKEKRSIFHRGY